MNQLSATGAPPSLDLSLLPFLVVPIRTLFASKGVEAFLVGGVVRDAFLGRRSTDIDVVADCNPHEIGADLARHVGGSSFPMDAARGIVRVVVHADEGPSFVDITRLDGDLLDDLGRRDFTLDAMAVSLVDEWSNGGPRTIDPWGGTSDLRAGIVRALGPSIFESDPVRLMRAPRLAAQLGLRIEENTANWIRLNSHLLGTVAPERVREELLKLLAESKATQSLRLLHDLALLCNVIPELAASQGVTQPREHYWNVFDHSLETVGQLERVTGNHEHDEGFVLEMVPRLDSLDDHLSQLVGDGHTRLTFLKLAGLLHDIAKPATKTVEETGRIRFLGHQEQGAEIAEQVLRRLRVGRKGTDLIRRIVQNHLRPSQMAQGEEMPTSRAIFRYYRDLGDAAIDTLYLSMADHLAARGPALERQEWSRRCAVIGHVLAAGLTREDREPVPKLVNGHMLMNAFSLEPGPQVGALLGLVEEAQGSGEVETAEEALELVRSSLESGGPGA